jgi:hypothetical protein
MSPTSGSWLLIVAFASALPLVTGCAGRATESHDANAGFGGSVVVCGSGSPADFGGSAS